MRQKRSSSVWQ